MRVKVFVEKDDGSISDVSPFVRSVGWNLAYSGVTLDVTAYIPESLVKNITGLEIESEQSRNTWKCAYCGKVNPGDATFCGEGQKDGCIRDKP